MSGPQILQLGNVKLGGPVERLSMSSVRHIRRVVLEKKTI